MHLTSSEMFFMALGILSIVAILGANLHLFSACPESPGWRRSTT